MNIACQKRACSAALALSIAAAGGGVALAAGSAPQLLSPHSGQRVKAGRITLLVRDTSRLARFGEFITITNVKHLDHYGNLAAPKNCTSGACDFVSAKPVKGHPGEFAYRSKIDFEGYWAATPGRYYWQAEHVDCAVKGCHAVSRIDSFRVAG